MNHHSYIIVFFFFFFLMIFFQFSISLNTLSSTETLTISSNRTLVSPGNDFVLGFFKPGANSRWYLGIWYKKVPDTTYVWVANRNKPLTKSTGTLKISEINLILLDHSNKTVWSTSLTKSDVKSSHLIAELLDNGNFVLRDSNNKSASPDRFLWQSFDFPTDTLLPGMKLGVDLKTGLNRFLRSWNNPNDPSSGNFSYKLETIGFPEFYTWVLDFQFHRSGPWDGTQFGGMPEIHYPNYMIYSFTDNKDEIFYTFLMNNQSIYSRLTLIPSGDLQRSIWFPISYGWKILWTEPTDNCEWYQNCGSYSYCDKTTSPACNCIKGFTPVNPTLWAMRDGSGGCLRRTPLTCNRDGFVRLKKMKLPVSKYTIVDKSIGLKECRKRCLKDCNCTAFANTDVRNGGSGCVIWIGELIDMRKYGDKGPDLYVRLADVDLDKKSNLSGKVKGLIIGFSVVLLLLSFIIFCFWKWKQKQATGAATAAPIVNQESSQDLLLSSTTNLSEENDDTDDFKLPMIEFEAIVMATDNFSDTNKLGKGGFGIVYKGRLVNGQEIAVKRLSLTSHQGVTEFKNEVKLIARLQHKNLVRLLACCVDMDEKLLIYEYLENLSLDSFIFDKKKSYKLDWKRRVEIINGIARGLLYLHQDSRFRIIHRDLKTSNILLDKNMIPKISDFGMARIIEGDKTEANTVKIVGTYGYMSPEYAMDGFYSIKSDVYSFGIMLLEIVSGKKNWRSSNTSSDITLLEYAWRKWKEGKEIEIIDAAIAESLSSFEELQRCIEIGLLCAQNHPEDRPTMSEVVLMLGSETTVIPKPQFPSHTVSRSGFQETDSSSSLSSQLFTEEYSTVNKLTVSMLLPR